MESVTSIEREERNYRVSSNPRIPYKNTVFGDIASIASSYGGVIVGSYALLIFNPNYKRGAKDVDVVTSKPATLARLVAGKMNDKYKDRFFVKKHVNSYKIYDKQTSVSVADFIRYPIRTKDYTIIGGVKVAYPKYVFAGRKRRARTRFTGAGIRVPRLKIWRLM